MKKILAKSLLVIIEAGLEVLAERISKRRNKNGNHDGLGRLPDGNGAYDLRDRSAAHPFTVVDGPGLSEKRTLGRSISWERQKTKKGGAQ